MSAYRSRRAGTSSFAHLTPDTWWDEYWQRGNGAIPDPPWAVVLGTTLNESSNNAVTGAAPGAIARALPDDATVLGGKVEFVQVTTDPASQAIVCVQLFGYLGYYGLEWNVAQAEWYIGPIGGATDPTGLVTETLDNVIFQWNLTDISTQVDGVEILNEPFGPISFGPGYVMISGTGGAGEQVFDSILTTRDPLA